MPNEVRKNSQKSPRILIVDDDAGQRSRLAERRDTVVVATPLELVFALEHTGVTVSTVMLAGRFVRDRVLMSFLGETYPQIGVDWLGVETN